MAPESEPASSYEWPLTEMTAWCAGKEPTTWTETPMASARGRRSVTRSAPTATGTVAPQCVEPSAVRTPNRTSAPEVLACVNRMVAEAGSSDSPEEPRLGLTGVQRRPGPGVEGVGGLVEVRPVAADQDGIRAKALRHLLHPRQRAGSRRERNEEVLRAP